MMAIAWAAVPIFFFVTGGLMHQAQKLDWRNTHLPFYRNLHLFDSGKRKRKDYAIKRISERIYESGIVR